jgi:hypothetical protein
VGVYTFEECYLLIGDSGGAASDAHSPDTNAQWLRALVDATLARRERLGVDVNMAGLHAPPQHMFGELDLGVRTRVRAEHCWDVTIGVRTGAGGAPRSPASAVTSADGERDLAVDIPSLVGARRFVLPKERTNILFYARKPFGAPLEQWDLLDFPVCDVHFTVISHD